jgi:hypothetical protein
LEPYKVVWECEQKKLCENAIKSTTRDRAPFSISYNDYLNAGLKGLTKYRVKAVAYANFIFGNGKRTSEAYVDLVWINFDPQAKVVGDS